MEKKINKEYIIMLAIFRCNNFRRRINDDYENIFGNN